LRRELATKKDCRKTRYATREEALETIREMVRKYPSVVYKKAYRCGKCRAWHITSTPPPRRSGRVKH
jgi:hypothetical protein